MTESWRIKLPAHFMVEQNNLVLKYLIQGRQSLTRVEWQQVLAGFDVLHEARAVSDSESLTFRQLYEIFVERPFADLYIDALLQLKAVSRDYHALRADFAHQIVQRLKQENLRQSGMPETNILLSYCLYFWESFAKGYAFEVEIYRDLTASGIVFQAHDIRDYQARLSAYDLRILDQYGDIKTSLYFLYTKRGRRLAHDFYVTRFYEGSRQRMLVVMLKSSAWEQINGDTVKTTLDEATKLFPAPALIQIENRPIVLIDYNVWKERVLKQQQGK